MENKLSNVFTKIFHDLAIQELRLQNSDFQNSNLTYNSMLYLNIITAYPNKYTASNIASMLQVSNPSVTQKINELEKDGYITKIQSTTDKRAYYLSSTEKSCPKEVASLRPDYKIENKLRKAYTEKQVDKFFEMMSFISNEYSNVLEGDSNDKKS